LRSAICATRSKGPRGPAVGYGPHRTIYLTGIDANGKVAEGFPVPSRCLHRQVGRLLSLEDAVHVAGRAPKWVDGVRPVGDQAAGRDEVAGGVDRLLARSRQSGLSALWPLVGVKRKNVCSM
jgi:hypothetical protein